MRAVARDHPALGGLALLFVRVVFVVGPAVLHRSRQLDELDPLGVHERVGLEGDLDVRPVSDDPFTVDG